MLRRLPSATLLLLFAAPRVPRHPSQLTQNIMRSRQAGADSDNAPADETARVLSVPLHRLSPLRCIATRRRRQAKPPSLAAQAALKHKAPYLSPRRPSRIGKPPCPVLLAAGQPIAENTVTRRGLGDWASARPSMSP